MSPSPSRHQRTPSLFGSICSRPPFNYRSRSATPIPQPMPLPFIFSVSSSRSSIRLQSPPLAPCNRSVLPFSSTTTTTPPRITPAATAIRPHVKPLKSNPQHPSLSSSAFVSAAAAASDRPCTAGNRTHMASPHSSSTPSLRSISVSLILTPISDSYFPLLSLTVSLSILSLSLSLSFSLLLSENRQPPPPPCSSRHCSLLPHSQIFSLSLSSPRLFSLSLPIVDLSSLPHFLSQPSVLLSLQQ